MTHESFTYSELLSFGWKKTKQHFWFLVLAAVVSIIISAVVSKIPVVNTLVQIALSIGWIAALLDITKGHEVTAKSFTRPFQTYKVIWHYFLATLVLFLAIGVPVALISLLLVVAIGVKNIPLLVTIGVLALIALLYIGTRVQFYKFLVVEHESMGPIAAIKKSIEMTKGRVWKLLGFIGVVMLLNILGALLLLVGLIATIPVSAIAGTELYRKLLA